MSQLRKQLQSARQHHRDARYAGDLAADVPQPRMRIGRWLGPTIGVVAAIAACVVVAMIVRSTPSNTNPNSPSNQIAIANPDRESVATHKGNDASASSEDEDVVPSWGDVSGTMSLAPNSDSIVPPAWSIVPSTDVLDTVPTTDSTATKNS